MNQVFIWDVEGVITVVTLAVIITVFLTIIMWSFIEWGFDTPVKFFGDKHG